MEYFKSIVEYNGKKYQNTWMPNVSFENLNPITQVYGIVFNDKGEILICRSAPDKKWTIPGGTPESGETIDQTLKRELIEETDVTVKEFYPLGAQKVELETENGLELSSYQLRFACLLDEMLPQTVDIDEKKNVIWERMFVPQNEVTNYVQWGELGAAMFSDAIKIINEKIQKN